MVRVLSLNVTDGGTTLHHPLLARLAELAPDLVTLQEIRSATVARWCADLRAAGYHLADTLELARHHGLPHPGPFRKDGLLIASRWPITPSTPPARTSPGPNDCSPSRSTTATELPPTSASPSARHPLCPLTEARDRTRQTPNRN